MLHLLNGDCAAETLRQTGVPGDKAAWSDVLHEGPTPKGLSPEQWREVRAGFHAECGWGTFEGCLTRLMAMDEALEDYRNHGEVVLWFEHDLFDQLILLRLLDWFAQRALGATKISLICIGEFPGFPNFHGLGQLNAQQLATLYGTQHEVAQGEFELATAAWRAYCSTDPRNLETLIVGDTSALPFLRGALIRHLEQYPSIRNGLSRTERQILEALETGPLRPGPLFQTEQQVEERPFMGDASFWLYVARLTKGAAPLVSVDGTESFKLPTGFGPYDEDFLNQTLALTGKGREVLQCQEDWMHISNLDRWLGGVHLQGSEAAWRWDESRNELVAAGDICSESRFGEEGTL